MYELTAIGLAAPVAVYILARIAGIAWHRSKRHYMDQLRRDLTERANDGT